MYAISTIFELLPSYWVYSIFFKATFLGKLVDFEPENRYLVLISLIPLVLL